MFGIGNFCRDRKGSSAMLFSLAMVPVVGAFALAVDYSNALKDRAAYQAIADAAALAGATASANDNDEARKKRAKDWFEAQVAAQKLTPASASFEVKNGKVQVALSFVHSPLIKLASLSDQTVTVASTAMISQETIRRVLDVAMCIDATGSMQNTINSVKARAQGFSEDLNKALKDRGYESFDYTRIRVVFYRDFDADRGRPKYDWWGRIYDYEPLPMHASDFFEMPGKKSQLEAYIGTQNAKGGGNLPESGYECIHEAMTSKWFKKNETIPGTEYKADEIYPVIIVWSDADALPIGHSASINATLYPSGAPSYPPAMPQSITAFVNKWNAEGIIDQKNRLLVHFGLCNNSSWSTARALTGYMCGGSLSDGNNNMINKIADVMAVRYQNKLTRLTN